MCKCVRGSECVYYVHVYACVQECIVCMCVVLCVCIQHIIHYNVLIERLPDVLSDKSSGEIKA